MSFRKGGKPAANDIICYGNRALKNVPHFKYLGIMLQTSSMVHTKHTKERIAAATGVSHSSLSRIVQDRKKHEAEGEKYTTYQKQ